METLIGINRAILHILDFNSNLTVFSEQELDLDSASVAAFLLKHVERSFFDSDLKHGTFNPPSPFKQQLQAYAEGSLSFVELSAQIAGSLYEAIAKSDKLVSADVLVCDISVNGESVIAILKCNNRIGFTHLVLQDAAGIKNSIINHFAILPNPTQKLDEYAFVWLESGDIRFVDKACSINGRKIYVLPELLLDCSSRISQKETLGLVTAITRKVAESHGESSVIAVSRAKTFLIENTEMSDYLDPIELGNEVFAASPLMQQQYLEEVNQAGISVAIKLDRGLAVRTGRTQKIKTDTGIEISIPIDYFNDKDYVEFFNNPDGTLSISLKKIGKLLDK
jgi:hypothetical protein